MKKKEIYIQDDASSCGSRCIQSVVSHYGGYVPLETVIEDTETGQNGTNAYELVNTLKKYGFDSYGLKIDLEKIDIESLPAIAHTVKNGFEHFLVIYNINNKYVTTMDPEVGEKVYSIEEFKSIYDKKLIVLVPNGEIPKYKRSNSLLQILIPLLKEVKCSLLEVIVLSILILGFSLLISFHLKMLEFTLQPYLLTGCFIILQIIVLIFNYNKGVLLEKISLYIDKESISNFTRHIFKLPQKYLKNRRVGEILKKIEDMSYIKNLFVRMTIINIIDIFTLVILYIILLIMYTKLTFIYTITIILYSIISFMHSRNYYKDEKNEIKLYNKYTGTLVEYLDGVESIKNLNLIDRSLNSINDCYEGFMKHSFKKNRRLLQINTFKNVILNIGSLMINLIGFLLLDSNFTFIDLMTFISITSLLFSSLESLLDTLMYYMKGRAIYTSACEFYDLEVEKSYPEYKLPFKEILLNNITYSYDKLHTVLNNFTFKIKIGDKILVKGPSGIGKSTFVKILSGRLLNYDGVVSLNDTNIKSMSIESLRNYCLYIGQEEKIFTGTILDNVITKEVDCDKFDRISKITMLNDVLEKRIYGENTSIMEGATNLSGGEKARIILARALYKEPSLLIIDETLSSVSEEMENEILKNIFSLENLTLIYITHRSKEKMFNQIIEFRKDGKYEFKRL